jgi:hypothetical protein
MPSPTDANILLLLCDIARQEVGGKITLLGYWAGELVQIPQGTVFPTLINVSAVFLLRDGQGSFTAQVELIGPAGVTVPPTALPQVNKPDANINHALIVNFTPFQASGFGTYQIVLRLNGQAFTRSFTLASS